MKKFGMRTTIIIIWQRIYKLFHMNKENLFSQKKQEKKI